MSAVGEKQFSELRNELQCPACEYSLRGLPGDVVTCPECGCRCNLADMVASRWTGSWRDAPGYGKLLVPVSWLATASWLVLPIYVFEIEAPSVPGSGIGTAMAVVIVIAVWILLLLITRRRFDPCRGLRLLVLSHVITAAYIAGLIAAIAGVIYALVEFDPPVNVISFAAAAGGVALILVCYQGEKYMARQCIEQRLIDKVVHARQHEQC